jgi:hypothetical protein
MNGTKRLAKEAKAIVALAFRNGPIEALRAGKPCPKCRRNRAYSRISDAEMMQIMRAAVDRVYSLLLLREKEPSRYEALVQFGETFTTSWGEPKLTGDF